MELFSHKLAAIKEGEYDRRGFTKAELSFLERTASGDFLRVSLDVFEQSKEKRVKAKVYNHRTQESVEVYADKLEKFLTPIIRSLR